MLLKKTSPNTRYFAQNSRNISQLRTKLDILKKEKSGKIWTCKLENLKTLAFSKVIF